MMSLRRAIELTRRIRVPSTSAIATRSRKATANSNSSSLPLCGFIRSGFFFGIVNFSSGKVDWNWKNMGGGTSQKPPLRFNCYLNILIAIILGFGSNISFSEEIDNNLGTNMETGEDGSGLRRIEDGSVISNIHTSKWRVFTDNGRDLFLQGKLMEAENYFLLALEEAKEGFGPRDPHVASACNNLAELYRVKKEFAKAEPLYLEAINILEESFGPEDVRVGVAYHNLGQFYLVQRKLEEARISYEMKGRVLGLGHSDYADTMYHLGTVLFLQGKEKDSIALIQDSIRILEEGGQGESVPCLRRLRYLSQVLSKSNQLKEAENVQRKILHIMELSKGWNSLDTIIAAEGLALTLQSSGSLQEAWQLLEKCLEIRKSILHEDNIQVFLCNYIAAKTSLLDLKIGFGVKGVYGVKEARKELDKAKVLLDNSIRVAQRVLDVSQKTRNIRKHKEPGGTRKDEHVALTILLQSCNAMGLLATNKKELEEAGEKHNIAEAEHGLLECVSAFKEYGNVVLISKSTEIKAEYLSCLRHLLSLMVERTDDKNSSMVQELKVEIKHIEAELSSIRKGPH
ncbi:hypothetical protein Sjap_024621 [Stephania japonica]|uniref:Uncharacterized protein n=1 Tax=Stephania japonica TaxID=461633 RepID=A0AAP0EDX8_9MAGN